MIAVPAGIVESGIVFMPVPVSSRGTLSRYRVTSGGPR